MKVSERVWFKLGEIYSLSQFHTTMNIDQEHSSGTPMRNILPNKTESLYINNTNTVQNRLLSAKHDKQLNPDIGCQLSQT